MKKDLEDIDIDVSTVELTRIAKTRRLQRIVKITTVASNALVIAAYIAYVIGEATYRRSLTDADACSASAYLDGGGTALRDYSPYAWLRFVVSVIINSWLIIVSGVLSKLVRGEAETGLFKENCRILLIIWGFIVTYIGWTIYAVAVTIVGYGTLFEINMTWLVFPAFCNFGPIALVLYTHFRNVQSISKILSAAWDGGQSPG